jgi:hypothetical protein
LVQTQWSTVETPTGPLPMSLTWGCQCLVRLGLPLCFPQKYIYSLKKRFPDYVLLSNLKNQQNMSQLLQSERRKYFVRTSLNKNLDNLETQGLFQKLQVIQKLDPIVL